MPWCEDCAKYWAPSTMTPDGRCPTCGRELDPPQPVAGDAAGEQAVDEKVPWHFKLMIAALVIYLVFRFYEMFFT
jgi:hypothetical protein